MISGNNKYVPLICAFAALFLLFPLTSLVWEIQHTEVFLLAILVVAIFTIEPRPIFRWVSLALAIPSYGVLLFGHEELAVFAHVIAICLYLIAWHAIAIDILRHNRINLNIIFGAIVVYCIIGALWGHLYALIDIAEDGNSFSSNESVFDYFYFSYVSLTAVGYGDMVPISQMARGFAVFEAILGQMFLAVFIARLVGRLSNPVE